MTAEVISTPRTIGIIEQLRNAVGRPEVLRTLAIAGGVLLLAASAAYYHWRNPHTPVIRSDGRGYYAYLRLYFVDRTVDFARLTGAEEISELFFRSPKTGRIAIEYPVGTAIAELPFFLAGHFVAIATGAPRDGLSPPYQWAIAAAGLGWLWIGLWATGQVLAGRFGWNIAVFTLAALLFGTNLLHYAVSEPSMSHIYAFSAVALMLWASQRFWAAPSSSRAFALGAAIAFLVSIRYYDLVLAPMALYPAIGRRDDARRFALPLAGGWLAGMLPQFAVGVYYLGSPLASTYSGTVFFWSHPKIFDALVGLRRGWWFWTPIAAIGVAGLVAGLWSGMRRFCAAALAGTAATVYLISAWIGWHMGAGFGHRAFVDCLPAIGVGLAILARRRWVIAAVCLLIPFNLFLTASFWNGEINELGSTPRAYWRMLSKPFRALGGVAENDSSQPEGLAAEVTVSATTLGPSELDITAHARNTGSALWLSDMSRGEVYMALRGFENGACDGPAAWEWREPIATDVAPGNSTTINSHIPASFLHRRFHYVCTEMLSVAWFRDVGPSRPAVVAIDGSRFAAGPAR